MHLKLEGVKKMGGGGGEGERMWILLALERMWILLAPRDGLGDRQVERREGSHCLRTGAQRRCWA